MKMIGRCIVALLVILVSACTVQQTTTAPTTTPVSAPGMEDDVKEMVVEPDEGAPAGEPEKGGGSIQTFSMTAKQWEFSPSTITVKQGDTVRLIIQNLDVAHGIAIPAFNVDEKIAPGETVTVEFVADKAGTFDFNCNVFCGAGHKSMRGSLIVKP